MKEVKADTIIPKKSMAISQDIAWMQPSANVVGSIITIDLSQHFNMLDSSKLTITALSSDNNIITPNVNGSTLTLNVKSIGIAIITVTASDEKSTLVDKFEVKLNKLGDLNGDGFINTADALLIYRVTSGKDIPADADKSRMDLNEDGKITNADADIIMNTYLGKPNTGIFSNSAVSIRNINDAPVATKAYIDGNATVGQTLNGNYSFIDVDSDLESSSTFKWYRATKADGSDKVLISGAISKQYTLGAEDGDKYIFFEVTPSATTGISNGSVTLSAASQKVIVPDTAAPSIDLTKFRFTNNQSPVEDTINGLAGAVAEKGAVIKAYPWTDANGDNKVDSAELQAPITLGISELDGSLSAKNVGDLLPGKYKYVITATDVAGNESAKNENSVLNVAVKALEVSLSNRNLLEENNINDASINLKIKGDSFKNIITSSDIVLKNGPAGLTVKNVSFIDDQDINVILDFDGSDFDAVINNFALEVKATAVVSGQSISTDNQTIKNSNDAPVASDVKVIGTAKVGETLTASYKYSDDENDAEGASVYKWYRASKADGSDKVVINGATSKQYTLSSEDGDKYIFIEVTPVASVGKTNGNFVLGLPSEKVVIPDTTAPTVDVSKFIFTDNLSPAEDVIVGMAGSVSEGGATVKAYLWNDTNGDGKVDEAELQMPINIGVSGQDGSMFAKNLGTVTPGRYKLVITATDASGNESAKNEAAVINIAARGLKAYVLNLGELEENNLNGAILTLSLKGDSFKNSISASDLILSNAPMGVSISNVSYVDEGHVEVTLSFDGTDFDATSNNVAIEVKAAAVESGKDISVDNIVIKNSNDAPVVSDVKVTGTAIVGQTLTGSYKYSDDENDAEGTSLYKWYRGSKEDGSDKVLISGAQSKQYTLTSEDGDKYLFFEVTPVAVSGGITGKSVLSSASEKIIIPDTTAPTVDINKFVFTGNTPLSDTILGIANAISEGGATVKAYPWVDINNDNKVDNAELLSPINLGTSMADGSILPVSLGQLTPGKYKYVITATDVAGNESVKNETSVVSFAIRDLNAVISNRGALEENNLEGATLTLNLKGDSFKSTATSADFDLRNAPAGTSIKNVSFVDESSVKITLGFDGTDFDSKVSNALVDVKASAVESNQFISSQNLTITNSNDAPVASDVTITGTARIGETLSASYNYTDDENDVEGTSVYKWYRGSKADGSDKVLIDGATSKQYTLAAEDGDKYIFFEVTPLAISGKETGKSALSSPSAKVIIPDTTAPSVNISKFNFINNDSPTQDSISGAVGAISEGGATIKAYSWNDANGDGKVDADELQSPITLGVSAQDGSVAAKNIGDLPEGKYNYVITATDEAGNESAKDVSAVFKISTRNVTASVFGGSELTESSLSAATIVVSISGDSYKDTVSEQDFALNNAPAGVEVVAAVPYDVNAYMLLLDNSGADFDTDYNNFSITVKGSGLESGQDITTKPMPIKAEIEGQAPNVAGLTFGPGDVVDNTKASALPDGTIKYVVGAAGQYARPNANDSASAYTNILGSTTNIPVTSGQHIYAVSVDNYNRIKAWSDITVTDSMIKQRPQVAGMFISEYLQGPNDRVAIEIYNNTGINYTDPNNTPYTLEVYQWVPATNKMRVVTSPISAYTGMVNIAIDAVFYDFFDISTAQYYNEELNIYGATTNAVVLKKNGQIVDVLGDPNFVGSKPIIADGNTMVRKKGIIGGYNVYYSKEWDVYNQNTTNIYQYIGGHSIN
jgi:hypothetical protein